MNKCILLGRLTADPVCRYTNSGKVVAQFQLAVDRPYAGKDGKKDADFLPVVIWGNNAETIGNTVSKGQRLLVEGRIQTRNYDGKDGIKRYVTEIIADRFEYIEKNTAKAGNMTRTQDDYNSFEDMGSEPSVPF